MDDIREVAMREVADVMMTGDPQEPHDDDYPTVQCPKCGKEQVDMDGFGFIACLSPDGKSWGCGYCVHPSRALVDGWWICGICGESQPSREGVK